MTSSAPSSPGPGSRWPAARRSPCWSWPATPRTPPAWTWPRARWSGSGWPGPRTTGPTWPPSTWSRPQLAEEPERDDLAQPEAVTADRPPPPPRDPPRPAGPHAPPPAGGPGGGARARVPRRVRPLLGVPGIPPLAGPGGPDQGPGPVPADRGPLDLDPLRLGTQRQLAPGRGPPGRAGPRRGPAGPPARARTWPPRSGSSPTTWWRRSPRPGTATATRRSAPCSRAS